MSLHRSANDSRYYKRKNRWKVVRTVLQTLLLLAVLFLAIRAVVLAPKYEPVEMPVTYASSDDYALEDPFEDLSLEDASRRNGFICLSYNGLTLSDDLDSRIVTQEAFMEQMAALHASGYVTITQQDVLNYYFYHMPLPERAMLLVFEDGIFNTTTLAQSTLEKYNYIATACTYAEGLDDTRQLFINAENMKGLLKNSFWELGSNGYRLSYINIFDRYGNYFGHLNTNEYVQIDEWLKRDYNHYLMDFLRDEDRLRQESVEEMEKRIEYDYDRMRDIYSAELGYIPSLYILMHSNTGAFGNDPLVSRKNHEMITQVFGMNFNRQGTCYNDLTSSVYDLSRLQSRHYFSTNHLLMRIWDDTGNDMAFVVGDEEEAARWFVGEGVAEFRGNEIILTTVPYGRAVMTLRNTLLDDCDMTVTLQGNKVGKQSVCLRADRNMSSGIEVALEFNELVVRDLSTATELFRLNLFEFDGGPFVSEEEDELAGLIALQNAIIEWDGDEERREEAAYELERLQAKTVVNLEEGGTPYFPELDISERDERKLRIRLVGSRLSIWIDDKPACDRLEVPSSGRGNLVLCSEVWKDTERYSQTNLYDDVYDAVFIDPLITEVDDEKTIFYQYRLNDMEKVDGAINRVLRKIVNVYNKVF